MHTIQLYISYTATYLQCIPVYENASNLGAKWLTTLWYASKLLVWWTGDNFSKALCKCGLKIMSLNFSYGLVPV